MTRAPSGHAVKVLVAPTPEAFVAALDACDGIIRDVAVHLGLGDPFRVHWLMKREPELGALHRAWLDARGRKKGSWPKFGTALSDAQIARVLDQSQTIIEAAKACGYSVPAFWSVAQRSTHPLTQAAYKALLERKRERRDQRGRLVREGIEALRAAIPGHGRMIRDEWRAIARAVGETRRPIWERDGYADNRKVQRTPDTLEALVELATVIPEMGPASAGLGAPDVWIGYTARSYPQVQDAFERALKAGMAASKEEWRRRQHRNWWSSRYSAEVRRERARIIDEIFRTYGSIGEYDKAHQRKPMKPSRTLVEMWLRQDRDLYKEGMYWKFPRDTTIRPVCSPVDLREPALIMRETATGDRWWQWGKWTAWVGDHDQSARLMLEHAIAGNPCMTRRLERVGDELWTRDGWERDSRMARWDPASNAAVWRPW